MMFDTILQGSWYRGNRMISDWLEANVGQMVTIERSDWTNWKVRLTGKLGVSDAVVEIKDRVLDKDGNDMLDEEGNRVEETVVYRVYIVRSKDGYVTFNARSVDRLYTDISTIHIR